MRSFDTTTFSRSTIGFDRLFSLLDAATKLDTQQTYPPCNIERLGENAYRIVIAVAGFAEKDLDIEVHESVLAVKGKREDTANNEAREFLYQGIAGRSFERRFHLADYVVVKGAHLENGLLKIDLERVIPEALKPRKIEIQSDGSTLIEDQAA